MGAKETIQALFESVDITINGVQPWHIQVHDERLYDRILSQGSLGFGEAYMDGWWDCDQLDVMLTLILRAGLERDVRMNLDTMGRVLLSRLVNWQRLHAFHIGEHHYDIGNDLYRAMLGPRMTYTCAYWRNAETLVQAQDAKLDLVCRKISLRHGDDVLDVGSGWGSFINYAADHYGVHCLGVTVSGEQALYANGNRRHERTRTVLQDYQSVEGLYDRIVSLGMFEHVGYKNYRAFFQKMRSVITDDGLFLLHTIGGNRTGYATDPWIAKYIFPNSMIPSAAQIAEASEGLFVIEDWHNFGHYYDTTLMAWWHNFHDHWAELSASYDERFYRMWKFYLLVSAASFRSRKNQLWQIVFSPRGVIGGYHSVR